MIEEKVIKMLRERGETCTTAESCTGGLLAGRLVNVPGASEAFGQGVITYSNEAKENILGVRKDTLRRVGAVSPETAGEMAAGAARMAGATLALSTTGIAGPGGGTEEKPVGLVYIGCYYKSVVSVEKHIFEGSRQENRNSAVQAALKMAERIMEERKEW